MNTDTIDRTTKASFDVTRCIVCKKRFGSSDVRQNAYKDDKLVGVMHDHCYDDYFIC